MQASFKGYKNMPRALIIDRRPLVRLALTHLLENFTDIEENDGDEYALKQAYQMRPDLIILGISQIAELLLLRRITMLPMALKIIVISDVSRADFSNHCLHDGATHVVNKSEEMSALTDAIREIVFNEDAVYEKTTVTH